MAEPREDTRAGAPLEVLLAWAALLPALLLSLPLPTRPLLVGVPTQVVAGSGAVLLAALPAAVLLTLRGLPTRPWPLLLLWVPLLSTVLGAGLTELPFDSLAADRSLYLLLTGTLLAFVGTTLGSRGRAVVVRGSVAVTLVLLVHALLDTLLDPARSWSGALENTGHLAAAALPGALVAAGSWSLAGKLRLLPLAATGGFLAYVALVPVHGASAAFLAAGLVAVLASPGEARRRNLLLALLSLALFLGAARLVPDGRDRSADGSAAAEQVAAVETSAPSAGRGELGGLTFRLLTWQRLDELALDHLWTGVGPGQFEAAFPPYRDPAEIELSTFGRTTPFETSVEHPHNDWVLPALELGLPVGLAWLAFLLLTALAALRALRSGDEGRALLGAAFLGLGAYAGVNGAFLGAPASSVLGFLLAGCLLGPDQPGPVPSISYRARMIPGLLLALGLAQAPRALDLLRQGLELRPLADEALVTILDENGEELVVHDPRAREEALRRSLARTSDSTVALAEWAALQRSLEAPIDLQEKAWSRVLDHQPLRFDALLSMGNLARSMGETGRAAEWYERARSVDARNPALLVNEVVLALDSPIGEGFGQESLLEALHRFLGGRTAEQLSVEERDVLRERAALQLLAGRLLPARLVLEAADPRLAEGCLEGELAYQLSGEFDGQGDLLADAFRAAAHLIWAREHAEAGDDGAAVRSYRQSLRSSRHHPAHQPSGAMAVRMELAAALVRAGRPDEARTELADLEPAPRVLRELPEWAGEALFEAGLLAR